MAANICIAISPPFLRPLRWHRRHATCRAALPDGALLLVQGDLATSLFSLGQQADAAVRLNLSEVTPTTYGLVLARPLLPLLHTAHAPQASGLLTSLSPCTLSVLPLTIGYIGGYSPEGERSSAPLAAASFAAGLATTLAALGMFASLVGKAYGQARRTSARARR